MKQNSNEHIVMSIAKTSKGIELQEDISGTLPELTSLLTLYVVHFVNILLRLRQQKMATSLTLKLS